MEVGPKVLQISTYSKSRRRLIVLARCSSTETHLYFTCWFSAYTQTCTLVLSQSYLICMYSLFICLFLELTIENKLTFLGFIFVFSKPAEETWRRTQEVRPYSQAVNSPQWPHHPFLFPPSILFPLCSPSPIHLASPPAVLLLLSLSFTGCLSSLSEADTIFVEAGSHSLSRPLHTALCFMLRHVGCSLLSIYFNYVLIARCPLLNACLLFPSGRCEKLAVDCDFLHYLNWW